MPESAAEPLSVASSHGPKPISHIAPEITAMTSSLSSGSTLRRATAMTNPMIASVNAA